MVDAKGNVEIIDFYNSKRLYLIEDAAAIARLKLHDMHVLTTMFNSYNFKLGENLSSYKLPNISKKRNSDC